MNLKELIDNNAEEIVVKGSYNDVHCAFSIYDKQNRYDFVKILSDNSFLFKLKQKDVVVKYELPKDYKKSYKLGLESDEISKVVRNEIGTDVATFDTSLEAYNLLGVDYESPIHMIYSELNQQVEEHIYKCVLNVGIDVSKEELIKALKYDRDQYDKGYQDAKAKYERPHGHWIYNTDEFTPKMRCSVCGYNRPIKCTCNDTVMFVEQEPTNFCNNCGAEMDEEDKE